jgi:hypothetical protein
MAGYRLKDNGTLNSVGSVGLYWSSTVGGSNSRFLLFDSSGAGMDVDGQANGFTVRCIKN